MITTRRRGILFLNYLTSIQYYSGDPEETLEIRESKF